MKIKWDKWSDPFKKVLKEHKNDLLYDESSYRRASYEGDFGPSMVTPFGIFPIHEDNCPSNIFNFWRGECDFTFTKGMFRKVAQIDGVEAIQADSRYRFRIAIGRQFDEKAVMAAIDDALCPPKKEQEPKDLFPDYKSWALVRVGNSSQLIGGTSAEDVRRKIPVGGNILRTSDGASQ